jgi:hypothetical protein
VFFNPTTGIDQLHHPSPRIKSAPPHHTRGLLQIHLQGEDREPRKKSRSAEEEDTKRKEDRTRSGKEEEKKETKKMKIRRRELGLLGTKPQGEERIIKKEKGPRQPRRKHGST